MIPGMLHARRAVAVAALAFFAAGLAACTKDIDGTYVAQGGIASIELKSGKATLTSNVGGTQTETADYTRDGDKITVKSKQGDLVFTIMKDGSLEGMLGTFKKSAG